MSRRLRQLLTIGFVVLAVGAAGAALWLRRAEVADALSRMSGLAVLGALLAGLAATVLTMLAWRAAVADLGGRLPLAGAGRVFFLGQLGKYLPGSVWPVVAQMELGKTYGVRRASSAAAASIVLVLSAVTGTLIAVVTLPLVSDGLFAEYRWVALGALPLLLLLVPAVQQWLVAAAGRVLRRPLELPRSSARGTAIAAAWMLAAWVLFGLQLHVLVASTCGCGPSLLRDLGVFALAWVAGFLFVVAPAGAGVREGVLVLGLAPVLDPGAALLVALASRVLLTAADLLLAGLGVLAARGRAPDALRSP